MMRLTNLIAATALSICLTAPAMADTSGKKIALSNGYAGNSWRQSMLESWKKIGDKAVTDKTVAAADAFTTAAKEAPQQAAHQRPRVHRRQLP